MNTVGFPNCCTSIVIYGFSNIVNTKDSIKSYVLNACATNSRKAIVTCITTKDQVNGIDALKELGFKRTRFLKKADHPETIIALWWAHIPSLLKKNNIT